MTTAVDNGTGYYCFLKKTNIKSLRLSSYDIDLTEANEKPQGSVSFSITLSATDFALNEINDERKELWEAEWWSGGPDHGT